jgi:septal ring factor EnvC (AmiA/AmiB activator)
MFNYIIIRLEKTLTTELQQTIDIETNKKFLKEKYYKEKNMLLKSIEMDSDSDDIQKSLVEHIESLKNEYNQTLNDLNDTNEQLKQSKNNIEDLNTKYSLMKKTLLKIMDQYETLKDSFDDDAPETIEKWAGSKILCLEISMLQMQRSHFAKLLDSFFCFGHEFLVLK